MNLSIKTDFSILSTKEPKEIVILDTSNWGVAYTKPSYLSILPPGYSEYIKISFVKKSTTILNSYNLGISCIKNNCGDIHLEDLDDGIWEFVLESSYQDLEKKRYYLKDDQLRTEIDKVRISLFQNQGFNLPPDNVAVKQLNTIEFLLSTSHSLVRQGMNSDSMQGYKETVKLLEKLKKCKNCI